MFQCLDWIPTKGQNLVTNERTFHHNVTLVWVALTPPPLGVNLKRAPLRIRVAHAECGPTRGGFKAQPPFTFGAHAENADRLEEAAHSRGPFSFRTETRMETRMAGKQVGVSEVGPAQRIGGRRREREYLEEGGGSPS